LPESDLVVIGGGIAGVTAALGAAESAYSVYIVEKNADIGGHGARLCCKATDACRQCGACVVADSLERVRSNPNISILASADLTRVSGRAGDFHLSLFCRDIQEEVLLDVGAIVVATGFEPFDARHKPQFGYKTCPNVVTGLDLEEQIRLTGSVACPSDGRQPSSVAFIQCVGSRDVHIGNDHCSRACCKYALRIASRIQVRIPDVEMTIFYMDIQTGGKGFYELYRTCRDTMRFMRTIPVNVVQDGAGSPEVQYEDVASGRLVREMFDMVVLSVGMVPARDANDLATILGIDAGSCGFFATPEPTDTNRTAVEGIWLAGACQGPKDIEGSIAHAQAAAMDAVSFLSSRRNILSEPLL
jgi:heterodisulfide reductase subunit A